MSDHKSRKPLDVSNLTPGNQVSINISFIVTDDDIEEAFHGRNPQVIIGFKEAHINYVLDKGSNGCSDITTEDTFRHKNDVVNGGAKVIDILADRKNKEIQSLIFRRIDAERNIVPEGTGKLDLQTSGGGATNTIYQYLNYDILNDKLVKKIMLEGLNYIYKPDSEFLEIDIRQHINTGNIWEIYLLDRYGNNIALSKMGSGLKTVLLVLIYIHLIPDSTETLKSCVFGFEELENYLHPAVLRRLFLYLRDIAIKHGCTFFITTHSNIVIDLFSNDKKAQIIHTVHDGKNVQVNKIANYLGYKGILSDLDVRASDLLQANCIVWVEGPTDRLYFNKWIDLWSKGIIKEGAHYQCVFYGGRLLAHLSADIPGSSKTTDPIEILKINTNAIMVIDSDKKSKSQTINSTKQRLADEINSIGGISWVTEGREIENYITERSIRELYPDITLRYDNNKYKRFWEKLEDVRYGSLKYQKMKVVFAEKIIPHITLEDLTCLDLKDKLDIIGNKIREWNQIKTIQ